MADFLARVNEHILNPIILLLLATAVIVLFWGIVQMIAGAESEEARSKGKRNILWGIIGMFIMLAVFGIMQIIVNTFGLETPGGGSPIESVLPE